MAAAAVATAAGIGSLLLWCAVTLWRPPRRSPRLEPGAPPRRFDDVDVIVPARNEADVLPGTLAALLAQGPGLRVLVVDDESADGTAAVAAAAGAAAVAAGSTVEVISGAPRPTGWSGKLWAQEQARQRLERPYTLLLDADIELDRGMLSALRERLQSGDLGLVSVLAKPQLGAVPERLLMPAYVFFFELMYPFRRANDPGSRVAAAAGGCVLVEGQLLQRLDAFRQIRGDLIDDCALARLVKRSGARTWIGLSRGAGSLRESGGWRGIHDLVARHAYTQLHYSPALLALTTVTMLLMFAVPVLAAAAALPLAAGWLAVAAWGLMTACYLPTLRYYRLSAAWALLLPVAGLAFLLMVWSSAWRYHVHGQRASWRGRTYALEGTP